jgi:CheY-like chemotaxis protein/signal transduction histidine kinase
MKAGNKESAIPKFDSKSFKQLLARNVLFPLCLSVLSSVIFVSLIFFQLSVQKEVEKSDVALVSARKVSKIVADAETGMRGFLITGDEPFLEPYYSALNASAAEIQHLYDLEAGHPLQQKRVELIKDRFRRWKVYAEDIIADRRAGRSVSAKVSAGFGKSLVDEIRENMGQLVDAEEALKMERSKSARDTTVYLLSIVIAVSLLSGALIAWVGRRQLLLLSESYSTALDTQVKQNQLLLKDQHLKANMASLSETMVGERNLDDLCEAVLSKLASILGFSVGSFYAAMDDQVLELRGSFARTESQRQKDTPVRLAFGEGLVGQAAKERHLLELTDVPEDYLNISSSLGGMVPRKLLIYPLETEGRIFGVLEFGFYEDNRAETLEFLRLASEAVAQAVRSARYKERLENLLREVREQAKILQAQQEELRVSNEELEEQTRLQRESQARLESQHTELEQTNAQLEVQSQQLEIKNDELEKIKQALEEKTGELQQSNRYKSEFLANMSHELRTPLNSSLILAKLLAENKEGNLTQKQVEFSRQILSSGGDLLLLINDILDLSKVESGKLEIISEEVSLENMLDSLQATFDPVAKQKNLRFDIVTAKDLPARILSDQKRVEQILKNLLSNAFKFTSQGGVELRVLKTPKGEISFSVKDSGIGIKKSQQKVIFEAFRQADGTTNRKYGGTGLGLSISKDLARLLQGELSLDSEEGRGSTFTLTLPLRQKAPVQPEEKKAPVKRSSIPDDRAAVDSSDRLILVVEDDARFAGILRDLVKERGFKFLAADTAEEGVALATEHLPDAILLDLGLPDHSGLMVLDQLKQNLKTRHIPIHVISARDGSERALKMGAVGFLTKPVEREQISEVLRRLEERIKKDFSNVLVIEDDEVQRKAIVELIAEEGVQITDVNTGKEALALLKKKSFDCVVMDLNLPDLSGFDLIDRLAEEEDCSYPPIIVYTGRDLNKEEELRLKRHSQSVIIKGARSPERLLNEVTLFLHQVESRLSPKRRKILEELQNRERIFEEKRILIVDDDVRNIFALTSALENKGAEVFMARNGREALDHLEKQKNMDLVLMDIMMPVMDGYEATKEIRARAEFKNLPIIALTAKAMADDRRKCLEAGASDYLTKPVDLDKLLSLMRVWLSQAGGFGHDLERGF